MSIWDSVIGAAGSAISTGMDIAAQQRMLQKQLDYNSMMWDRQADYNLDMYNRQYSDTLAMYERQLADARENTADERAYNSPAAEAARLKAAGINPALQGVNSPTSPASSTPSGSVPGAAGAPAAQPINFSQFVPNFATLVENIVDVLGSVEDLRAKHLANRNAETDVIDDAISSVVTPETLRSLADDVNYGTFVRLLSSKDGGAREFSYLSPEELNSYKKFSGISGIISNALMSEGISKKRAYRLSRRALNRIRSSEFKAKYLGELDSSESSLYGMTSTRSSLGYSPFGDVSGELADLAKVLTTYNLMVSGSNADNAKARSYINKIIREWSEKKGPGSWISHLGAGLLSGLLNFGPVVSSVLPHTTISKKR